MTLVKPKEGVARDQSLFIAGRKIESGCMLILISTLCNECNPHPADLLI